MSGFLTLAGITLTFAIALASFLFVGSDNNTTKIWEYPGLNKNIFREKLSPCPFLNDIQFLWFQQSGVRRVFHQPQQDDTGHFIPDADFLFAHPIAPRNTVPISHGG